MKKESIRNPPEIFIPEHKKFVLLTKYVSQVENILNVSTQQIVATEGEVHKTVKMLPWQGCFDNLVIDFSGKEPVRNYIQINFDQLWNSPGAILKQEDSK